LANLCERIPGANVDNITQALGHDKRISPHYFRGGPGFGGTCFPRDTKAYIALAKKLGVQAEIIAAVDEANNFQNLHILDLIENYLPEDDRTVAILGTAFKPGTPVVEESLASYLIPRLVARNINVMVYDPLANDQSRRIFGDEISYGETAAQCVNSSAVVVVANNDPSFKVISPDDFRTGAVVIDCWRILNSPALVRKVNYVPIGAFSLF
jgi:UDPglucose 6-dehydrogenase